MSFAEESISPGGFEYLGEDGRKDFVIAGKAKPNLMKYPKTQGEVPI